MVKNGLFLLSLGFLIFVLGAMNRDMRIESVPLLIISLVFIVLGSLVFYKGNKKYQESKKEEKNEDK